MCSILKSIHSLQIICSTCTIPPDIELFDFLFDLPILPKNIIAKLSNVSITEWSYNFSSETELEIDLKTSVHKPPNNQSLKGSVVFLESSLLECNPITAEEPSKSSRRKSIQENLSVLSSLYEQSESLDTADQKRQGWVSNSNLRESRRKSLLKVQYNEKERREEKFSQLYYKFYDSSIQILSGTPSNLIRHALGEATLGFGKTVCFQLRFCAS